MLEKDKGRVLSSWGCPVEENTLAKVGSNLSTMLGVKIHDT